MTFQLSANTRSGSAEFGVEGIRSEICSVGPANGAEFIDLDLSKK
jgi:hypothetical protein